MWYSIYMERTLLVSPIVVDREQLHMTQQELADAIGVSRNFLIRAENGEYPKLPTPIVDFLSSGDEEHANMLRSRYRAYQAESRHNAFGLLDPDFDFDEAVTANKSHPFIAWVVYSSHRNGMALTTYEVCKEFCVHQAVIHRWVTNAKTVKDVPKIFLEALQESGYSEAVLIALQSAYQNYRRALLT